MDNKLFLIDIAERVVVTDFTNMEIKEMIDEYINCYPNLKEYMAVDCMTAAD